MLSQSLMNLVDTALIGHLGEVSLAAVGTGSYAILLMTAILSGLSAAIQAQVARLEGQNKGQYRATPVNAGLGLSVIIGVPLVAIGLWLSPQLLRLIASDSGVSQLAEAYFDIRLFCLPAAAMSLSFRGYWNSIKTPARFVKILIIVHSLNVFSSWVLIYGELGFPALGVKGAALGTVIAMYAGALINGLYMFKEARSNGFLRQFPNLNHYQQLIRLALPDSFQQLLFALSLMVLFAILAQAGVTAMALGHLLINASLFLILPALGFGMAATTLVSHAIGSGNEHQAYIWGRDAALVATGFLVLLNLPIWLFSTQILGLFTNDQTMIDAGILPLRLTGLGITTEAAGLVLTQALLGAGASRTVMKVRLIGQWLILLPLYWWAIHIMEFGLTEVCILHAVQRVINSLIFISIWKRKHWLKQDLVTPIL